MAASAAQNRRSLLLQIFVASVGAACLGVGAAVREWEPARRLVLAGISFWKGVPPSPEWEAKIASISIEALLGGLFLLVVAAASWRGERLLRWLERRPRGVALFSYALLLGIWMPVTLVSRSVAIGGERYWWLFDDGMISMRFARNLAQGSGLVWNAGERVEGYSNFLWTLWMAVFHWLPIPESKTSLLVLLTNVAIGLLSLAVISRLVGVLGGKALALAGSLIAFAISRDVLTWATGGLETTLVGLLFLLAMLRILEEAESAAPRLSTFFIITLIPLVRTDGIVLAFLLIGLGLALNGNRRRALLYAAASLALPIAHEIFRLAYYGELLSNTAYLKTLHWSGRYVAGIRHTLLFCVQYSPLLALALLDARKGGRRRLLFGLIALYAGYVAYVGGDAFQNYRFFVPIVPLLVILAFRAIEELPAGDGARVALAGLVLLPLIAPNYPLTLFTNLNDRDNVKLGLLLKENTSPEARIADAYAGSVIYFSGRYGIDLLGKSDRHIAHDVVAVEGRRAGHNKFDYDYSVGHMRPDVVIAMLHFPEDEGRIEAESHGDTPFIGQLFLNPIFRQHCLPNPINVQTPRSVFICDWSQEMARRNRWRAAPYFESSPLPVGQLGDSR